MDMVEPVCSLKLISSLHALSKHDRVSLEPWLILLSASIKDIYAITHLAWTFWDMVSLHSPEPRDSRSAIASQVHSTLVIFPEVTCLSFYFPVFYFRTKMLSFCDNTALLSNVPWRSRVAHYFVFKSSPLPTSGQRRTEFCPYISWVSNLTLRATAWALCLLSYVISSYWTEVTP